MIGNLFGGALSLGKQALILAGMGLGKSPALIQGALSVTINPWATALMINPMIGRMAVGTALVTNVAHSASNVFEREMEQAALSREQESMARLNYQDESMGVGLAMHQIQMNRRRGF